MRGTREGDIYSFAIILFEMIGRKGPYGGVNLEPKGNYGSIEMHFNYLSVLIHRKKRCKKNI